MNRVAVNIIFSLVMATTGCTYDLTEITTQARAPSFVVVVETFWGSDTRVRVHVDPGITERGTVGTFVSESLFVDGAAHAPTARLDEGGRLYDIPVPESATSLSILLPSPEGMTQVPTLAVAPIVLVVPDTLVPNAAGVLELTFSGVGEVNASSQSNWSAALRVAGSLVAQFTGGPAIPSVVQIPTVHLPAEVQAGHVGVLAVSLESFRIDNAVEIAVHRMMRASVPFRISR